MTRGVLLFAFNNGQTDYFEMAVRTAKRIKHFLNLPTSVVTDSKTELPNYENVFDNVIIDVAVTSNIKDKVVWINKGRHKAYELSPYDETLVLDTDYLINSDTLLKPFELYDDFMCHNHARFMMTDAYPEKISNTFLETCWATVIYFKKTSRTKQIFECMQMVQDNYKHYVNLFGMYNTMYRNDYSLTIALWIVNGHSHAINDYIPWQLLHLERDINAHKISDTEYIFITNHKYISLKDVDFHIMDKKVFMELTNE